MSSLFNDRDASEDLFADSRMSFGDHIEELRWHLIRAIVGTGLVVIGVFILDGIGLLVNPYLLPYHFEIGAGKPLMEFIARPVERELMSFYQQRIERVSKQKEANKQPAPEELPTTQMFFSANELRQAAGMPVREGAEDRLVPLTVRIKPAQIASKIAHDSIEMIRPPLLTTLSITEAFMVYLKVSLVLGVVLASPWIFLQLWSFVAAGLYPSEKRYVHVYGPFSLGLFLAGVVLCELIVIPAAVHYLLSFNEWMGMEPELRLSDWLSFALLTPLVFGIAFQTPLVMLFLHKLGIVDESVFRKHWRIAVIALALIACLLAASPDAFSMLALAIPLWGLYVLGIVLCRMSPRTLFDDAPDEEDMVEV